MFPWTRGYWANLQRSAVHLVLPSSATEGRQTRLASRASGRIELRMLPIPMARMIIREERSRVGSGTRLGQGGRSLIQSRCRAHEPP